MFFSKTERVRDTATGEIVQSKGMVVCSPDWISRMLLSIVTLQGRFSSTSLRRQHEYSQSSMSPGQQQFKNIMQICLQKSELDNCFQLSAGLIQFIKIVAHYNISSTDYICCHLCHLCLENEFKAFTKLQRGVVFSKRRSLWYVLSKPLCEAIRPLHFCHIVQWCVWCLLG